LRHKDKQLSKNISSFSSTTVNPGKEKRTEAPDNHNDGQVLGMAFSAIDPTYINQLVDARVSQLISEGKLSAGMVSNDNGKTTSVIGGTPLVTYVPPVQNQGFGGASLAGFTDLSAKNFNAANITASDSLTVSGRAVFNSIVTFATTTITDLTVSGLTMSAGASGHQVGLQASSSTAASYTLTLPTTIPSAGKAMLTDANGNLYWGDAGGASLWSSSGSNIYYTSGNVGVGTTSPVFPLQVHTASYGNASHFGTTDSGITLKADSSGVASVIGINAGSTYNALALRTGALGTGIYINTSGNVGIGTAGPATRLDVVPATPGTATVSPIAIFESRLLNGLAGEGGYIGFRQNDVGNGIVTQDAARIAAIHEASNTSKGNTGLAFYTSPADGSAVERLRIDRNGNLGIGTTTPSQKLVVSGNAYITGQLFDSSYNAGTSGQILTSTGTGTSWQNAATALAGSFFLQGGNSFGTTAVLGTNDNNNLAFETNNTTRMTILANGNVGIGTTGPVSKLHITGTSANDYVTVDAGINLRAVIPPAAPTATLIAAAGNVDAGDHRYFVTFTTPDGETSKGALSATITADASHGQVQLTNIPISTDYRVTGRKIYRTIASSPVYYFKLLTTINDNTTTTFIDNVSDANLSGGTSYPGYWYMENTTNKYVLANGQRALYLGDQNTVFGNGAGPVFSSIANANTIIGVNSGKVLTDASADTLVGSQAGLRLTTGSSNTFVGNTAGYGIATTSNNVMIGNYTGYGISTVGQDNVAVGNRIAFNAGIGLQNTIVGNFAGYNMSGSSNVILGYGAGYNSTGSNNVFLGFQAGYYETGSNKLIVDAISRANEADARSKALIYGVFDASPANQILSINGNVGIGTTSPIVRSGWSAPWLTLSSAATGIAMIDSNSANSTRYLTSNGGQMLFGKMNDDGTSASDQMVITATGNVGIGTTSPLAKLEVESSTAQRYTLSVKNTSTGGGQGLYVETADGNTGWYTLRVKNITGDVLAIPTNGGVGVGTTTVGSRLVVQGTGDTSATSALNVQNSNGTSMLFVRNDGNVGIGTTGPRTILEVNNPAGLNANGSEVLRLTSSYGSGTIGSGGYLNFGSNLNNTVFGQVRSLVENASPLQIGMAFSTYNNGLGEAMRITGSGNVGIGTTSPTEMLHIGSATSGGNVRIANGWLCVDDNDTCTGATTPGNIYMSGAAVTTGADVAESYPTLDSTLEAGDVVAIEGVNPAYVIRATSTTPAIGIISSKPGVLLNGYKSEFSDTASSVPVALAGRVPVKVSGENGDIRPGDTLVLSKIYPGYATKASGPAFVLGRALSGYHFISENDKGMVLIFVQPGQYLPKTADLMQNGGNEGLMADITVLDLNDAEAFNGLVVTGNMLVGRNLVVKEKIQAAELVANTITAKEKLCVGETCVTEDQLKALLEMVQQGSVAGASTVNQTSPPQSTQVEESTPSEESEPSIFTEETVLPEKGDTAPAGDGAADGPLTVTAPSPAPDSAEGSAAQEPVATE